MQTERKTRFLSYLKYSPATQRGKVAEWQYFNRAICKEVGRLGWKAFPSSPKIAYFPAGEHGSFQSKL